MIGEHVDETEQYRFGNRSDRNSVHSGPSDVVFSTDAAKANGLTIAPQYGYDRDGNLVFHSVSFVSNEDAADADLHSDGKCNDANADRIREFGRPFANDYESFCDSFVNALLAHYRNSGDRRP